MTKREKYFKDDITPNEAYDLLFEFVGYISLLKVDSQDGRIKTYDKVMEFLNQPLKPTLTEDEKVILRNIEFKDYMVIGRKESGDLYVNDKEKDSFNGTWFIMFKKHLFQFIKTGEEYSIKELLDEDRS